MLVAASVTHPQQTQNSHRKFNLHLRENPILPEEEIQFSAPWEPSTLALLPGARSVYRSNGLSIANRRLLGRSALMGAGGAVHKGGGGRGGGVSPGACSRQQIRQKNMVSAGTQEQGIMYTSAFYCIRCLKRQFKPLGRNYLLFLDVLWYWMCLPCWDWLGKIWNLLVFCLVERMHKSSSN